MSNFSSFATRAVHSGQEPEEWNFMPLVTPISLSTTFKQKFPGQPDKYEYSRSGNPTRNSLEQCLASLDNAKYGLSYSSGLSALNNMVSLFKAGDHIVSVDDVYGGTFRYLDNIASKMGIETSFVDATNLNVFKQSLRPNTKMVWLETPTNPTLKIVDIQAVCEVSKKYNKDIIVVVDNTFLTCYFQRPLDLGADVVNYSLTKYMNGHTDVVMGSLCTNDENLYNQLKYLQNAIGGVPSPFDCYMVSRGLRTLHVRMKEHFTNALIIAQYLEKHPGGLPSHPQHDVAKKQATGHSGMVTFYLKGNLEQARIFLNRLKIFMLAESLGGYESLAEHPSLMTHASVPEDVRAKLGISDNLIRLSVGLEDVKDLIQDLEQALKAALQ